MALYLKFRRQPHSRGRQNETQNTPCHCTKSLPHLTIVCGYVPDRTGDDLRAAINTGRDHRTRKRGIKLQPLQLNPAFYTIARENVVQTTPPWQLIPPHPCYCCLKKWSRPNDSSLESQNSQGKDRGKGASRGLVHARGRSGRQPRNGRPSAKN